VEVLRRPEACDWGGVLGPPPFLPNSASWSLSDYSCKEQTPISSLDTSLCSCAVVPQMTIVLL
jgi:hypothetical protein